MAKIISEKEFVKLTKRVDVINNYVKALIRLDTADRKVSKANVAAISSLQDDVDDEIEHCIGLLKDRDKLRKQVNQLRKQVNQMSKDIIILEKYVVNKMK